MFKRYLILLIGFYCPLSAMDRDRDAAALRIPTGSVPLFESFNIKVETPQKIRLKSPLSLKLLANLALCNRPETKLPLLNNTSPLYLNEFLGWANKHHKNFKCSDFIPIITDSLESDYTPMLQELLHAGLDPTILVPYRIAGPNVSINVELPLICITARARSKNCLEMLLKYGADVNAIGQSFVQVYADELHSPVIIAIKNKDLGCLRYLLDTKKVTESQSYQLKLAVMNGFWQGVLLMLAAGYDVNANVGSDITRGPDFSLWWTRAIHWAMHNGDVPMLRILRDAGADLNALDIHGRAVAHLAALQSTPDALELLQTADNNIRDNRGNTPLMFANCPEDVRILAARNVNLNAKNRTGETALIHAVIGGKTLVVKALLEAGAAPHLTNNENETALDIAYRYKQFGCVELLEQAEEEYYNFLTTPLPFSSLDIKKN